MLKSVLHNWDVDRSVAILQNCRRAIHDTARLLVIERLVPDGRQPSDAKLFDINMLVTVGGKADPAVHNCWICFKQPMSNHRCLDSS